jgi:hypothetical protein
VLIAIIIIGAAFLIRASLKAAESAHSPDSAKEAEKAYREAIDQIRAAASLSMIQEAATSTSAAIRRYLAAATGDPSLFETHEEFLARHEALKGYPIEVRNEASTGFTRLARLKYGKSPDGDASLIADEAQHLLAKLHQNRPA